MELQTFYDPPTGTLTYVAFDETTRDAVVIDPVLDYDPLASRLATTAVAEVASFVAQRELTLHWVLETHAHADHVSASQWLKRRFGARVAIGERIRDVQKTFAAALDLRELATDGRQFDRLLSDGEVLRAGSLAIEVLATPGHTPACVSYRVGDAVFTGDALFVPDSGTGRCDFPMGSADALYTSVHDRLYALPDGTRVFVGHDYRVGGRDFCAETTIGRSKAANVQLRSSTSREEFVAMRTQRDATLAAPRLLYPSIQINVDGGRLPSPRANGRRYLTIPLDERAVEE